MRGADAHHNAIGRGLIHSGRGRVMPRLWQP